jgi:hypothetical protein
MQRLQCVVPALSPSLYTELSGRARLRAVLLVQWARRKSAHTASVAVWGQLWSAGQLFARG